MIDTEHKFIFIHLPKSGGSTVEVALTGAPAVGDHARPDSETLKDPSISKYFPCGRHGTLPRYKRFVEQRLHERMEDYRLFTVTRSPEALLRSLYRFLKKNQQVEQQTNPIRVLQQKLSFSSYGAFLISVLGAWGLYRVFPSRAVVRRCKSLALPDLYFGHDPVPQLKVFRLEDIACASTALEDYLSALVDRPIKLGHHNKSTERREPDKLPRLTRWVCQIVYGDAFSRLGTHGLTDDKSRLEDPALLNTAEVDESGQFESSKRTAR